MKNKQDLSKVITAIMHVKTFYPDVTIVIFSKDQRWLYLTESFGVPVFDNRIDVSILEEAADSIETLPFIHEL